ncbi:MAG TPA: hypothetical protein VFE79_25970 [Paraburkholderia sp.]|jgi:hypothetical protein|nr:hypothetical protein [Paraburkholderia sp.]
MKAEVSGQRAHFAQEFCGDTPDHVKQYKAKLRAVLKQATEFDTRWQTGWKRGENDSIQMRALRTSSPREFDARVKSNCGRLKWLEANALRTHPPK